MVESVGPEVLHTFMNEYIDGMVGIVFKHNGTLDKVVGDALCIFFPHQLLRQIMLSVRSIVHSNSMLGREIMLPA